MECPFVVGQKVVCIARPKDNSKINPIVGNIYTIREIHVGWSGEKYVVGVYLKEVVNKPRRCNVSPNATKIIEPGFVHTLFKPLHSGMKTLENILKNPTDWIIPTEKEREKIKV